MSTEYVEIIDNDGAEETVANTASRIEIYRTSDRVTGGIIGGTLGLTNSLRITMAGTISVPSASGILAIELEYGTTPLLAGLEFGTVSGELPIISGGLVVEALLSAQGSETYQKLHMVGSMEIDANNQVGIPVTHAGGIEASAADQELVMYAQWDFANPGFSFTKEHVMVEKIGTPIEVSVSDPTPPATKIVSVSLLNRLPSSLFKDVTFYADLLHNLDHTGVGDPVFTRASTSTAVWRDGASHSVAVNEGRFSYNGDTARGLLLNTTTEALTFSTANNLSDSNPLYWFESGTLKHTTSPSASSNPFGGGGSWTSATNIYIKHILKFGRTLTAAEDTLVQSIMTNYAE